MNAADSILSAAFRQRLGGQTALLCDGKALSYEQVRDAVGRSAQALRGLGLPPGGRVLLLLRDSPALVGAYLGAIAAGGVAVTISLRVTTAELETAVSDSQCEIVLIDAALFPVFAPALGGGRRPPRIYSVHGPVAGFPSWEECCARARPEFICEDMAPDAAAFWIYTSGTTGELKGCVHRHEAVLPASDYLRETLGLRPGMRLHATSKLFFAYALGTCLFGAFQLGATTILAPEWPTPDSVARIVEASRPDAVFSVPAMYRALLRSGAARRPAFRRVSRWISAGEKLSQPLYDRWREATGGEIVEGMGTSETIYMILTNRPGDSRGGSTGFPAPGAVVELRDGQGRRIAAPETPGTMWVQMTSASREYWNRPELTAAAMRDGWFVTGDVFDMAADGRWRHHGRLEERIAAGESWVNPADVEAELTELECVMDAALVMEPRRRTPALYLVAAPGHAPDQAASAALALLASRWPRLAAARAKVLGELPRTASGKVQRYRLREIAAAEQEQPFNAQGDRT